MLVVRARFYCFNVRFSGIRGVFGRFLSDSAV